MSLTIILRLQLTTFENKFGYIKIKRKILSEYFFSLLLLNNMVFANDASGRSFTDYTPSCVLNDKIKKQAGISDNYSYKLYIQRNADKLMQADRSKASQVSIMCSCLKCKK
jgi:hypothetical protein